MNLLEKQNTISEVKNFKTMKSKCSNWSYRPISTRRCRSLQQGRHKANQARSIIVKQWRWVTKGEKERHAWSRTCCFQMLTEDQPLGRTMAGRKEQKQLGMELNSFPLVVEPLLALLTQATIIKLRSVGPQNGQRHENPGDGCSREKRFGRMTEGYGGENDQSIHVHMKLSHTWKHIVLFCF